jgi:hypothetical protein
MMHVKRYRDLFVEGNGLEARDRQVVKYVVQVKALASRLAQRVPCRGHREAA